MAKKPLSSLSVFVPVYNEEANIPLVIQDALEYCNKVTDQFELIIVNDGSSDHTVKIVESYSRQYPQIRLVSHSRNRGYGAAIKTGFKSARYDWIFFTDSDRQFRFDELPHFVTFTERADYVVGYRRRRRDPLLRLILAQGFLRIWNYCLFGLTIRDVDCAYKLIPRALIENVKLSTESAITVTELIYRLNKAGYTYVQVPVTHYSRPYGHQTGSKPKVILKALKESLILWQKLK
jgi:glycosyltransferase involved in cell wall biosynthesis